MGAINIITLQGYYYLYALYFDYPLSNAYFADAENAERLRESLRTVQRLRALVQPHRKSWSLRLFTERDAMARFSPDLVNTVLFQLRDLMEQLGPPPGWSRGPLPNLRSGSAMRAPRRARDVEPMTMPSQGERPPNPFQRPPSTFRLTG